MHVGIERRMIEIAYLVSATLTHLVTNLDNFAVLLILSARIGVWRSSLAYCVSQITIFALAVVSAGYIGDLGAWSRYFGILPIALGSYFLLVQLRACAGVNEPKVAAASFGAATLTFLGLGLDTLLVFAPILADGGVSWNVIALFGASISIAFLSCGAMILSSVVIEFREISRRISGMAPYAMILVGMYIIMDTSTDID